MGASTSKAASTAATAATKETVKRSTNVILKNLPADAVVPPADPITGFHRGAVMFEQEERQRQFLESQRKGAKKEMPPELIRFIQDVGPVRRSDEPTKKQQQQREPRLPRSVKPPSSSATAAAAAVVPTQHADVDPTRRVQSMRLAENIPGFETKRTTSFSYRRDVVDPYDYGLDVVGFYKVLQMRRNAYRTTTTTSQNDNDDKTIAETFYHATQPSDPTQATTATATTALPEGLETRRQRQMQLLQQSLQYIELPVLLKDDDESYVGAWPEKTTEFLEMPHFKMRPLAKHDAILVLEDLYEIEETKKQQLQEAAPQQQKQ
jgi:hypothetical protein